MRRFENWGVAYVSFRKFGGCSQTLEIGQSVVLRLGVVCYARAPHPGTPCHFVIHLDFDSIGDSLYHYWC